MKNAQDWIERLKMEAHPEGGFFAETYRSPQVANQRNLSTSIYFLLRSEDISKFHVLQSDELWYFHEGSPLTIYQIDQEGALSQFRLGVDEEDSHPCHLVPAQTIFGATVDQPDSYTLISCVVSPGFDFEDFKLFDTKTLAERFPKHRAIIEKLT